MKIKRIVILVLIAAMLLCALCSCGEKNVTKTPSSDAHKAYAEGKSAYEIYTIGEKQTNALKAYSARMTEFIEIKYPAASTESGSTINMDTLRQADLTDAENPVAYYEITYQRDGNILTGCSAGAAEEFTLKFIEALRGKEAAEKIAAAVICR